MRKPAVIANWKMNKTRAEAEDFAREFSRKFPSHVIGRVDVAICPAFAHLAPLADCGLPVAAALGGQDCHWEAKGAYTGCVSPGMLKDLKARFVLVGHSERRRDWGESEEMLGRKLLAALEAGLQPIYCVGERLEERDAGRTFAVLERQIKALEAVPAKLRQDPAGFLVAYEPVWAIGTGKNATPDQAQEAHNFARSQIEKCWGKSAAEGTRILYGGSVTPQNFSSILERPDVDGALVGGASLEVESFLKLIHIAMDAYAAHVG